MPRVAVILADGFETIEAFFPVDILRRLIGNENITLAGMSKLEVVSDQGVRVLADCTVSELSGIYDMLIIPGGFDASVAIGKDERIQNLLMDQRNGGRWIAAICAAPAYAIKGVLGEAKGICYPSCFKDMGKNYIEHDGGCYTDEQNKIITSRGPGTAADFGLAIAAALGIDGSKVARGMLL